MILCELCRQRDIQWSSFSNERWSQLGLTSRLDASSRRSNTRLCRSATRACISLCSFLNQIHFIIKLYPTERYLFSLHVLYHYTIYFDIITVNCFYAFYRHIRLWWRFSECTWWNSQQQLAANYSMIILWRSLQVPAIAVCFSWHKDNTDPTD